jgi:microcystin-dependent protein
MVLCADSIFALQTKVFRWQILYTISPPASAGEIASKEYVDGVAASGGAVLSGTIMAFSGAFGGTNSKYPVNRKTGEPDTGYALCDGGTYMAPDGVNVTTPDLRNRFVLGAGSSYNPGATGGSTATGATTLTEATMPSHCHVDGQLNDATNHMAYGGAYIGDGSNGQIVSQTSKPRRYGAYTNYAGSSQSHTHTGLPPYYALCYIMKL